MGSRRAGLSRSALLRVSDKGIIERHESDSIGIVRPRLKLTPDGSMNAQRHFWPRTSLIGRNLFPCNLVGRAVTPFLEMCEVAGLRTRLRLRFGMGLSPP